MIDVFAGTEACKTYYEKNIFTDLNIHCLYFCL
jgi:hypothetical protein